MTDTDKIRAVIAKERDALLCHHASNTRNERDIIKARARIARLERRLTSVTSHERP